MNFYKWGIEIFDTRYAKYGGHSQWIGKLMKYKLASLSIQFCNWEISHNREYYDGWHNALYLGFIVIAWEN